MSLSHNLTTSHPVAQYQQAIGKSWPNIWSRLPAERFPTFVVVLLE
jgi:hypothetical protein